MKNLYSNHKAENTRPNPETFIMFSSAASVSNKHVHNTHYMQEPTRMHYPDAMKDGKETHTLRNQIM